MIGTDNWQITSVAIIQGLWVHTETCLCLRAYWSNKNKSLHLQW